MNQQFDRQQAFVINNLELLGKALLDLLLENELLLKIAEMYRKRSSDRSTSEEIVSEITSTFDELSLKFPNLPIDESSSFNPKAILIRAMNILGEQSGKFYTDEEIEKIVRLYKDGLNPNQIYDLLKDEEQRYSRYGIYRLLSSLGLLEHERINSPKYESWYGNRKGNQERWLDEEKEELIRLFNEGLTYQEIADRLARTKNGVESQVIKLNLKRKENPPSWKPEETRILIEMILQGSSYTEVAKALGRTKSSVSNKTDSLRKAGKLTLES